MSYTTEPKEDDLLPDSTVVDPTTPLPCETARQVVVGVLATAILDILLVEQASSSGDT